MKDSTRQIAEQHWRSLGPVRVLRDRLEMTQLAFASACGISMTTVQKMEQGRLTPTLDTMTKVALKCGEDPVKTLQKFIDWRERFPDTLEKAKILVEYFSSKVKE